MDPNTATRIGQFAVGFGFVVGLLLLRLGRGLAPTIKVIVAAGLTAALLLGWLASSMGFHARDMSMDAGLAALLAAALPAASLTYRWWHTQRRFRVASWIGVGLSVYGIAGSLLSMSTGTRLSSKRIEVDGTTTVVVSTASSPRTPQRVVLLEVRHAVAGLPAVERRTLTKYVDGVTVPLSEIEMQAELLGADITLTMRHAGSVLREVTLPNG